MAREAAPHASPRSRHMIAQNAPGLAEGARCNLCVSFMGDNHADSDPPIAIVSRRGSAQGTSSSPTAPPSFSQPATLRETLLVKRSRTPAPMSSSGMKWAPKLSSAA